MSCFFLWCWVPLWSGWTSGSLGSASASQTLRQSWLFSVLSVLIQGEGERVDGCPLTFSFSKPWAAILCQPLDMSPEISLTRCLPSRAVVTGQTDGTMEGRVNTYIRK